MKSDPQRIRHFVPLLAATIGDYTGEIEHEECPKPILLSDATDVKSYVDSFFVESFRTEWMDIDTLPLDHDKTPAAPYPPISPSIVTSRTSVPDWYAQRRIGWEVAIVGSRGNTWSPEAAIIGFNLRPRLTFLQLHIYIYLLLSDTCRSQKWGLVRYRSTDRCLLDWRSDAELTPGLYALIDDDTGVYMDIRLDQRIPRFIGDGPIPDLQQEANIPDSKLNRSFRASLPIERATIDQPSGGDDACVHGHDSPLPLAQLRAAVNKLDVIERDIVCQITGHGFPGSTDIFKGPSVGHVIPIPRTDIADRLRWCINPGYHARRGGTYTRAAAVSDLSNVMLLCENIKDTFNNLGLFVDLFQEQPRACRLHSMWTRAEVPEDEDVAFLLGPAFPHPPRRTRHVRNSSGRDLPSIATVSLFIHMISALHASCTIPELAAELQNEKQEVDPIITWRTNSLAGSRPPPPDIDDNQDAPLQDGDCQSPSTDGDRGVTTTSACRPHDVDNSFDYLGEAPLSPDRNSIFAGRSSTSDHDADLLALYHADYEWENGEYDKQVRHGC